MGLPMSMDLDFNIFRPLTWGSPCQWTISERTAFQINACLWRRAGGGTVYFLTTNIPFPLIMYYCKPIDHMYIVFRA